MSKLLAVALMFASSAAFAAGEDMCKKVSALAGGAMEARQRGDLLEDAMAKVGDQSKFSNGIVLKAFGYPVAESGQAKDNAVSSFRNEAYAECYHAHN